MLHKHSQINLTRSAYLKWWGIYASYLSNAASSWQYAAYATVDPMLHLSRDFVDTYKTKSALLTPAPDSPTDW